MPNLNWPLVIEANFRNLGLTEKGLKYVREVVGAPPSRNPSNATRRNLIVDFASRKMMCTLGVESLTVEAGYAQMLEIPIPCTGYWPQPQKAPFVCTGRDGVARTIWLTFDFLVAYPDHVELVECKKEAAALALSLELPGRYKRDESGKWCAPEVEAALEEYGIKFRIVTDAELNPTLLRNYTLLEEARQDRYSSTVVLDKILECFPKNSHGVPLADLIAKAGTGYTKNDVYFGILRRDLHVLLADCLLVNDQTTLVFAQECQAEAYRLLNFETKGYVEKPLILKTGTRLRWNGSEYIVCNASREKVYLRSKDCEPTAFPQRLIVSLLQSGEIVPLGTEVLTLDDQKESLKPYLKVLTPENQAKAICKRRFLDFLARHSDARSVDFDLSEVSLRTVQRWKKEAHQSIVRFGTSFWGLLDQPRPGRPRDDLPKEMRGEMTAVAHELYFTKEGRSKNCVWRVLRKRREERGLSSPSKGAFYRHIGAMKNHRDRVESREGKGAAYKYGASKTVGENWATAGDFPLKVAQMDGKTYDIMVVDNETGECLGKPNITLMTLPHCGSAPIGAALLFEPESYRSGTLTLRDQIKRFGEPVKFLIVDNGKAFNNATFDALLATLEITKINRPPRDPRFASEIEAVFRTIDREVIHNLAGNTKPLQAAREMSAEMNPEKLAVWTLSALWERLEHYLFTLLWEAPSAALGTTARLAFERDQKRAPDRENRFVLPPDQAKIAFFPEVDGRTRLVQPGRGIYIEGYYYWHEFMAKPGVEKTKVSVRYDPHELYLAYAAIGDTWVECVARHAPELRNATERTRHLQVIARRRLKNNHAERREKIHGRKLGELNETMYTDEKVLREQRRARAQRQIADKKSGETPTPPANSNSSNVEMPKVDFSHLTKKAA